MHTETSRAFSEKSHKTSFACHYGIYQCIRMSFGLKLSPATNRHMLYTVSKRVEWKTCLFLIDYIIIYYTTVEKHINHVEEILVTVSKASVTVKMKNWKSLSAKKRYLGHCIRSGRLYIGHANTASLREAKLRYKNSKICSFVGFFSVYKSLIPNFKVIYHPINEFLRKAELQNFILDE